MGTANKEDKEEFLADFEDQSTIIEPVKEEQRQENVTDFNLTNLSHYKIK